MKCRVLTKKKFYPACSIVLRVARVYLDRDTTSIGQFYVVGDIIIGGGGGGTKQNFIQGGSTPRNNPLPFCIPFLTEEAPLSYTYH